VDWSFSGPKSDHFASLDGHGTSDAADSGTLVLRARAQTTLHGTGSVRQSQAMVRVWVRWVWPVLAGALVAIGLLGAAVAYGRLGLVLAFLTLSLISLVLTRGLSQEFAIPRRRVVPIGLKSSLAVLVLLGLCELSPLLGVPVGTLVALSSPTALRTTTRLRRRFRLRSVSTDLADAQVLERRFHEIVGDLRPSNDMGESDLPES